MSLADDMNSLRENIDAAQADRTKWISDNQKDTKEVLKGTHDMLKRFRHEHKEMAGVLRRDLESYVTNIKKETKGLLADARTMMKGYRAELDGMHEAWMGKAGETKRKRHKKTEEEGGAQ